MHFDLVGRRYPRSEIIFQNKLLRSFFTWLFRTEQFHIELAIVFQAIQPAIGDKSEYPREWTQIHLGWSVSRVVPYEEIMHRYFHIIQVPASQLIFVANDHTLGFTDVDGIDLKLV